MKEAQVIEDNYMKGFPGVKRYQDRQRDLVMKLGYINTCPEVGYRAYVYNYEDLKEIQSKFNAEFWNRYRVAKAEDPNNEIVKSVRRFFKSKSEWERASVNYPIQSRASAIYKIFIVNLFNWIINNNLFNIVKFCIPVHDEINLEAPVEIAEKVAQKTHEYMVKAGKFICKIVPLDAEVSRDSTGDLPTYWIH